MSKRKNNEIMKLYGVDIPAWRDPVDEEEHPLPDVLTTLLRLHAALTNQVCALPALNRAVEAVSD